MRNSSPKAYVELLDTVSRKCFFIIPVIKIIIFFLGVATTRLRSIKRYSCTAKLKDIPAVQRFLDNNLKFGNKLIQA